MATEEKEQGSQGPNKGLTTKQPKAGLGNLPGKKKKKDIFIIIDGSSPSEKILNEVFIKTDDKQKMAKGGRAGYKSGSMCKIATKGKGRAYGKNS